MQMLSGFPHLFAAETWLLCKGKLIVLDLLYNKKNAPKFWERSVHVFIDFIELRDYFTSSKSTSVTVSSLPPAFGFAPGWPPANGLAPAPG